MLAAAGSLLTVVVIVAMLVVTIAFGAHSTGAARVGTLGGVNCCVQSHGSGGKSNLAARSAMATAKEVNDVDCIFTSD